MLKGISTLVEYDECINKGLCEEHLKDINKNQLAAVKKEFPKKAFKYVRVNVLYPFLCGKPPKCEKMKKLMEKTPLIDKALNDGKAGCAVSEETAKVILVVDSVVIFTICQLSKICCIGAIFHTTKKSDDPHINSIQTLLLVERLNADIRLLYPVLQKNFEGFDLPMIRATYCITLFFIRKFCHKGSIKKAIEVIENDITTNCSFKEVTVVCNEYNYKNISCVIQKTSTSSSASFNDFYSPKDYMELSNLFYNEKNYELASLYGYLGVSMEDSVGEAYYPYVKALLIQQMFKEAIDVINYGIEHCEKNSKQYKKLTKLLGGLSKHLGPLTDESTNDVSENSVNHNDIKDKILSHKKDKSKCGLVDLVDSDSGESDSEVKKDDPGLPNNVDSEDNSEVVEKKEIQSEKIEEQQLPECVKEDAVTQEDDKLADAANSDDECENKKKKQMMCGTKEKTKIKAYSRRKRTISESSVDNQPEEEIDINKINSYLKEASEALLADCGYKAVQIFRGPLRKFIESSDFLSFEECDIVCIKYSYGVAYCKSGGHDDLEKCITILKNIIENHDSITFPAAHYALGLAFRKLNRFKEALNYLEIVQNFLNKGIHFKVYPWPGMTTVIQETKPDILKNLVQDLIKECENPPNPDAFCRYESCGFQPTIYYTDPDFKGYISLSCSEQCNLQYHLQCWKIMKEEKNLTDKDFLEKQCFTPDCEGFIAKIQNIDKKGDLAKEFTSEFKKPQKAPKKWEKKIDNKEKKKKKTAIKSEGGSEEVLTENGKDHSRKSSICENEASENKRDYSRESSICDNETISQFSGSCISNDEISCKSEYNEKSFDDLNQKDVPSSSSNFISSSLQESHSANHVENFKELSIPPQENKTQLIESIKNNTYSYLADFLQYHGPLRINDPLLTNEIDSFPEEIYNIITKIGGIGEFLKNDLRFAFVGDLYICIIDDLAKAYQMLSNASLSGDYHQNFPTLESTVAPKYYCENGELPDAKHSSFLNPDAQEYTPSSNKSNVYKFTANSLHQDFDSSCCSLPVNLDSPSKHANSVSELDTFPVSEMLVGKSRSCEAVSNSQFKNNAELENFSAHSKKENFLTTNESGSKSELHADLINPKSDKFAVVDEFRNFSDKKIDSSTSSEKSSSDITDDSPSESAVSKQKKIEADLKEVFERHFDEEILGEEMLKYHKSMVLFLKNKYADNKMEETASTGTNTDIKFLLEECKNCETASALDKDNVIEGLKKEIYDLSKQNSSLQNVLECTTEQQQKLTAEVARLKKCVNDSALRIENVKKEFEKREKDLQKEKETLVQCLTDANKFVGTLQQKNASLSEEKLKLLKTVDELTLSLKKEEGKRKTALDAQEKKFNGVIESLQKENAELKSRTKHAEFQVLFMKKTEYLKRIEAKSIEVEEVKKEMSTPSMKLWANAAGPEQMKILSTKLNNYVEELKAIRQEFVEKIDEQMKKVKNGGALKDLKEVPMKDLAPVPTYKNTLPEHLFAGMSRLNSMALPYFGTPAHMPSPAIVPPVPTASSLLSSATSSLKITPPAAPTKMIPPISPVAATNLISPLAPIAATNIIPPAPPAAAVVPPSAASITPASLSSSVPSAHNKNKDNKLDLVNDIDPTIQESFKSAMASINSYASSPYLVPPLDDEFDKKCVVFKHPEPVLNDTKPDHPKVPPGLVNSVPHSASARASAITPIPEPSLEAYNTSGEKSYANLDAVPKIKTTTTQSTWDLEKKKTTTASYSKLLTKLKEQFPTYTQEELISYVKDVRAQRQGKLSGLTIDAIIAEISAIMKAKKKVSEPKVQPKPAKVLVNKKLAADPTKIPAEPQTTKKKSAWNIDTDAAPRKFSGSADDDCTICYDTMENSAYKVACGHFFHEDCIRQWLKKNSNCPICRILLLLPEEYPSLS